MKKTSSSQFELMIAFMEQHGDLTKQPSNVKERVAAIHRWDELTTLLNTDGSGDVKTCEKWKKVWSDYKNNTKKKVARLDKAAHATGGGPAVYAKISDLEQRVLNLIGVQVATSLVVEEVGLSQRTVTPCNIDRPDYAISIDSQLVEYSENPEKPWPASFTTKTSPPFPFEEVHIRSSQACNEPGQSTNTAQILTVPAESPLHVTVDVKEECLSPTPSMLSSPDCVPQEPPAIAVSNLTTSFHAGQTTSRPVGHTSSRARVRGSPRQARRLRQTEVATEQYLKKQWRNIKMEQHRDYMELRREQIRIREMEVQAQRGWQALGTRALDLIEKLVNKYT